MMNSTEDITIVQSTLETETHQPDSNTSALDSHFVWLLAVVRVVAMYVDPSVFIIGIIGNTLAIVVFFKNNKQNSAHFLVALALSDLGQNISALIYWVYLAVIGRININTCKMIVFFFAYFMLCSAWLITIMTIQKYLAVRFPLRFWQFRTKKVLLKVIIALLTVCAPSVIPIIYTVHIGAGDTCNTFVKQTTLNLVYNWVYMSLHFLVPFCVLVVFNPLIIHAVRKSRKTVQEFVQNAPNSASSNPNCSHLSTARSSTTVNSVQDVQDDTSGTTATDCSAVSCVIDDHHDDDTVTTTNNRVIAQDQNSITANEQEMTRMFFTVTLSFLSLLLPFYLQTLFFTFYGIHNARVQVIHTFCLVISRTLLCCNSAINCYLCILISEKFRSHLKNLFKRQ